MPKAIKAARKTISEAIGITREEARLNWARSESVGEESAVVYSDSMDSTFNFNWTMRADGKFDKKANGQLTPPQKEELATERNAARADYMDAVMGIKTPYLELNKEEKAQVNDKFDNRWNYLKRLSKHRVADEQAKAKKSERELYLDYLRKAYNKATSPESEASLDEINMLKDVCKKAGLILDEI